MRRLRLAAHFIAAAAAPAAFAGPVAAAATNRPPAAAEAPAPPRPDGPAVPLAPLAPSPDGPLEQSVRNEVDRALELAEAWLAAPGDDQPAKERPGPKPSAEEVFGLSGLSRNEKALRLVSSQRVEKGTGYWTDPRPENTPGRLSQQEATALAVSALRKL